MTMTTNSKVGLLRLLSLMVVAAVLMYVPDHDAATPVAERPSIPEVASGPSLVEKHDCWSGEAPADMEGQIPGHVIVSKAGEAPRYAGSRMVGKALDQIFAGEAHDLTVYGFCR